MSQSFDRTSVWSWLGLRRRECSSSRDDGITREAGSRDRNVRTGRGHHQHHDRRRHLPVAGQRGRVARPRGADCLPGVRGRDGADRVVHRRRGQPRVAHRRTVRVRRQGLRALHRIPLGRAAVHAGNLRHRGGVHGIFREHRSTRAGAVRTGRVDRAPRRRVRVLVDRQFKRRHARRASEFDRDRREAPATRARSGRRRLLHQPEESRDRRDARRGRCGANVAAPDLRVCRHRVRPGAKR